jgi:hypothetical protein
MSAQQMNKLATFCVESPLNAGEVEPEYLFAAYRVELSAKGERWELFNYASAPSRTSQSSIDFVVLKDCNPEMIALTELREIYANSIVTNEWTRAI